MGFRVTKVTAYFPAAALVLLLIDLAGIPLVTEDAPPILPPAGEVLPGTAPYTFAVIGDSRGNQPVFDSIIERVQQDGTAFVLHGGDLVKRCTAKQYRWLLHEIQEQNLKVPFCPVAGNHDVQRELVDQGKRGSMLYERSFGQLHYWFAYDETLFVALDTSGKGIREDELVWLDRTLSLHRPQYRTCIVFTHVPPHNPQAGGGHDLGKGGDRLMAVLEKWNVTALFASHVHSYAEESIRGVPVYITGGGGADLDHPDDTFHYLLCRIDSDGKLTVTKEDVPTLPNHDYLEYVARAKWGREALRGLSAGLLFIGLCAGWLTRRRAKHANAGSEAAKDGANPGGPRC